VMITGIDSFAHELTEWSHFTIEITLQ
jgi:hypothetical protein